MVEDELRLLKCIASEIRLKILQTLEEDEKCVRELMDELNEEQSLISHHLNSLRDCGLINRRREGRNIVYSLSRSSVSDFLNKIENLSKEFCQNFETD